MAEIINLRRARKERDRRLKASAADENAAKFGRTKPDKEIEEAAADRAARTHDGHRIEDEE